MHSQELVHLNKSQTNTFTLSDMCNILVLICFFDFFQSLYSLLYHFIYEYRTLLGDKHVDTVVTMYNLAELLLVMGTDGK